MESTGEYWKPVYNILEESLDLLVVTPQHIKPEWYFLAVYQALKLSEGLSVIGAWAPKLAGVIGP